jgi:DNA-binding NarL/FixJ family response regulator
VSEERERERVDQGSQMREYRVVCADTNEVVWLSVFARFVYDENGKAVRHIGIAFDSTRRKQMEEELRKSHDELGMLIRDLREKSENLQEVNAALKVLLRQREEDRKELGESVVANVRNLIIPYTEKLKQSPLNSAQMTWMKILESHINEITSSFGRTLAAQYANLTSTEIRIAALIRDGRSTAKIAELSGISEKTVCRHRDNIRKKLGLRGGGINLRTHFLSLQ